MGEALILLLNEVVVAVIVPLVGALVSWFLYEKIGVERTKKVHEAIMNKKDLAKASVYFVEQAYKDLGGKEKYSAAVSKFTDLAQDNGVKIKESEIESLIESSVLEMNKEISKSWKSVIGD